MSWAGYGICSAGYGVCSAGYGICSAGYGICSADMAYVVGNLWISYDEMVLGAFETFDRNIIKCLRRWMKYSKWNDWSCNKTNHYVD